jgi:DNA-binding XRE family transcriptional regulator
MSSASTRKDDRKPKDAVDLARAKRVVRPRKGRERVSLRSVREVMGKTQADVARAIGTDQGEVSRIERRGDVRLSTLRRYAEAVGARLEIAMVFEATGDRALIEQPDPDADPIR